ncbi:MAG: hypothetical protein ACTH6N_06105 [Brachybacterium tyrofermentans]|uniref:hypothetical protein n=1 Tax=Brachybacterium tyrofermentans TaxID=47848 RepID=UPI001867E59B|nr:hypothetical protein [Brachybacterium tyrofermentans]
MNPGGRDSLGTARTELRPMRETVRGRKMLWERISLAILTLLALGAALVLIVVGALRADGALAITGVVVGVVCVPMFAYVALLAVGALRTTVTVHDEGLSLRQTWGARPVVLWRDVRAVEPARAAHGSCRVAVHQRSGEIVMPDRLNLLLPGGTADELAQHPDVQTVVEHYVRWCELHGVPPRFAA